MFVVSVGLPVCHMAPLGFAVQKRPNRSRWCLGEHSWGPKEHCVRRGSWSPDSDGEGDSMQPSPYYFGLLFCSLGDTTYHMFGEIQFICRWSVTWHNVCMQAAFLQSVWLSHWQNCVTSDSWTVCLSSTRYWRSSLVQTRLRTLRTVLLLTPSSCRCGRSVHDMIQLHKFMLLNHVVVHFWICSLVISSSSSTVDCLEKFVSEMTYSVSSGT